MNSKSLFGKGRKSRVFAPVAAAAALILGLAGCATDGGDAAEATDEPIVIGGTLGLTGIYSGPSAAYEVTYKYWADEVNAAGGILGRQVELKIYDDESNPTTAQQLYQQLINEDEVDILLAPYTTAVGGAIVPIAERAGKLIVNAGFVAKELHGKADLMVSTWPYQESEYPRPLFEWIDTLPEDQKPKSLAVVSAQNPFTLVARSGVNGEGGVLNYAKERGIDVVVDEEYDQTATDLSSLISRVKQSNADMFIALSLPNDAALIANTVLQADYRPDIYCQCGSQVTTLPNWPDTGEAGVNVFATTTSWPTLPYNGLKEFSDYILGKLSVPVLPAYASAGYAAGQVIQQAVEATGSLDSEVLREYIGKNTFDTAVGKISYNEDGTVAFNALLLQYQKGGNALVWPENVSTGDAVLPLR